MRKYIDEKHYLEITPAHWDGVYRVTVSKYEIMERGFVSTCPFDKGNFNIRIKEGRKSQKKLDSISAFIESSIESLYQLWSEGKYQEMANLFYKQGF